MRLSKFVLLIQQSKFETSYETKGYWISMSFWEKRGGNTDVEKLSYIDYDFRLKHYFLFMFLFTSSIKKEHSLFTSSIKK